MADRHSFVATETFRALLLIGKVLTLERKQHCSRCSRRLNHHVFAFSILRERLLRTASELPVDKGISEPLRYAVFRPRR